MNRWQLHDTSPVLATASNLSLPATPRRQHSKYQIPLPAFDEIMEMMEPCDLRQTRSEEFVKTNKVSPYEQRRRTSLNVPIHPFFSGTSPEEKSKITTPQDCSPPKPQRYGSIIKNHMGPTRHRRRRSRSLDHFLSSAKDDSPPPKPERVLSRKNLFVQGERANGGHRRTRSRSLNMRMVVDVSMSPPCEQSRGMDQPSPSATVPCFPALTQRAKAKRNSRVNGNRNHRRTRSRSLDLTLDFNFLNTPKCEQSRGPCLPSPTLIGISPSEKFPSDNTPTTEKKSNTSRRHQKGKHRRMRSRSLDVRDLEPNLPDHQMNPTGKPIDRNGTQRRSSDFQGGSTWIMPSYPQRQLMRRISSLTMDSDSLRRHRTVVVDEAEPTPTHPGPNLEETNRLTSSGKPVGKEQEQNAEKIQAVLPPPPPPPPPSFTKSKYTPPSPLCFSGSDPKWNYTPKKSNKAKLSPFASELIAISSDGTPRSREPKKVPSPPPAIQPMMGHCFDSSSPHIWLLEGRKTIRPNNENVNRGQTSTQVLSPVRQQYQLQSIKRPCVHAEKSGGSGGSTSRSRVYKPPLPLQPVSTFLIGPGTAKSE